MNHTTGQNLQVEMPRVRRPRTKSRPVPERVLQSVLTPHDPRISLGSRLAASAGLRRSEIIVVHVDDFREDLLGRSLLVHGKGGTDRLVPLANGLVAAIRNYVAAHHITGYLFPGECDGHIGSNWFGKLINQQLPRPWNLHGLRHRFATTIYQRTHDIIVDQQLLGHESVATTQRHLAYTPSNSAAPSTSPTRHKPTRPAAPTVATDLQRRRSEPWPLHHEHHGPQQ